MDKEKLRIRHNFLLECLRKIEKEEQSDISDERKQQLELEKVQHIDEIDKIRNELKINTSTVIEINDI